MDMATSFARQVDVRSEAALLSGARRGDESAIRALIKTNNQRLFRVARAVLRDDGEAEDVVQETYVRAFTHLADFREEAAFSTWLTRIALNEALGRKRRRKPTVQPEAIDETVVLFPGVTSPEAPDQAAGRRELRHLLEQAIDALPEAFRVVFILREIEGLDVEETAGQLGLKPATVKTRLHRARRLIKAHLESRLTPVFNDIFPFDGVRCTRLADRVIEALASA
jgi:RNA polymerase sigma-70 factor (ECF subfamily)